MLDILVSIAPIFLLIVLGHGLRRGGIPSTEFWNLNDKLVYWLLFPSLLFYKISTIELATGLVGSIATVVLGAFAGAVLFGLVAGRLLRLDGPSASSLLQGVARHNTFIALAVAERLFGAEGLALAALATALLIPTTNVTVVTVMIAQLRERGGGGAFRAILRDLARNPLLIAVLLGIIVNQMGTGRIPVVHEVTQLLGAAALPVVLLCVGANIQIQSMRADLVPTVVAVLGKLVVFPALIVGLGLAIGMSHYALLIVLLFGAVPTAPSGFTLARQMGGNAPLMAGIIAVETALAFLTLPLTVTIAERLL